MFASRLFRPQRLFLWLLLLLITAVPITAAQDEEPAPADLFISGSNATSLPEIELRAYGIDEAGDPINLAILPLSVTHGGQPAETVEVIGVHPAGVFTLFIVDVPPGISDQLPAIEQAITGFADPERMAEEIDAVAVYRVGVSSAEQLLAPTGFHNALRNLFASPLSTQVGLTALYDSVVGLLNDVDAIKPRPDMVTQVVLMTDGTDAISTQFEAEDIAARAAALGIPVHTIWLNNVNLSAEGQEQGQEFLASISQETNGISAAIDDEEALASIWQRIPRFREQAVIHYTMPDLVSGSFPVNLSLADAPDVSDSTTIDIPPGAPMLSLVLPTGSRSLTLPDLVEPVTLAFETEYSWLDGVEREPVRAQLLVNNAVVTDIEPDSLDSFTADISNFVYGINSVRVAMVDDAGGGATSPAVLMTVREGPTEIPDALQSSGFNLPSLSLPSLLPESGFPWLLCILSLLVLLLLAGAVAWWYRIRVPGLGRLRKRSGRRVEGRPGPGTNVTYGPVDDIYQSSPPAPPSTPASLPYLEIIQTQTEVPQFIEISGVEVRIGRSPTQADLVFENDPTVSRLHASIVRDGYEYRLYDEQSTSGTLVNGIPVPAQGVALIDGDEIHLGAVHMQFNHR